MGSQVPLPSENGSGVLQQREWRCSISSDDGAISASQINNMELDGEWFGDADPAVVLQTKESPAMILLLSIANAAADVIPGLSHAPMPWDGPLPRRGPSARDASHSSQPISNQDAEATSSSSSSAGYYRLPWYRRPLRSPQFAAAAQAVEFPSQGPGRSNFPPLFGASPGSDISIRLDAATAAFEESSSANATPAETRIFIPAAYVPSGADMGERRATEEVRGQRSDGDDELRGERGALRGADAIEVSGQDAIYAGSRRHSVVMTTPSQAPTEDEDRRESREVDISPIQLTVEAAPTPLRVPRDEDSEGSPSRTFLPPGVGVPEAPTEEAPSAPVSSPVNPQPVIAELENTPGSVEEHNIRELKAEVNRLKREMAAMAAGFAGKMTYRSAKAESMERSPPPQEASRSENPGTAPWKCGAAAAGGSDVHAAGDVQEPSKLSTEVTSTVVTPPSSSTKLGSTRLRTDDLWDQRRREGDKGRGDVEGHPRPRGGAEVCGMGSAAVFRMEDDSCMRRVTVASVLPTPASVGGTPEGDRNSVLYPDTNARVGEQDVNSTPEFNRIPPVVANVMLSPPARRRSSSFGLGPSPASGEKTVGGSGGGAGCGVEDARVQHGRRETGEVDIASLVSRGPGDGSDRGADVGGGGIGGGIRGKRPSHTGSSDGRVRDDERGGRPDHVAIDGNITVRPSIFFPVQDRTAEGPRSRATETLGGSAPAKQAPGPSKPPAPAAPTSAAPVSGPSQTPPRAGGSTEVHAPGSGGKSKSRSSSSSRRRDLVTDNTLWRWVLAQRTENPTVRQALISHGLPPLSRRRVWAAWSGVAKPIPPPQAPSHKRKGPAEASLASVSNIISHDVQRTKILHPLFTGSSQAIPILKRVLLRCAQIGAVKDAGYIQGMNFLAGFLIINCADSIVAERGDESPATPVSGKRVEGAVKLTRHQSEPRGATVSSAGAGGRAGKARDRGKKERVVELTDEEAEVVEAECVDVMLGLVALQGGVLSRDLCGLHSNTELVEELLSRHCPPIMEHLRSLSLELIVLTPRWFICIYAASIASQSVVARIWDLYLWHGRRGPAVLVWVALGILHGCRRRLLESEALPTAVSAVRRFAEGCKSFADLVRQAPVGLNQVVTAWEEHGDNRKILALDGEGPIPDAVVGSLVREMTGEMVSLPLPPDATSPRGFRDSNGFPGGGGSAGGGGGGGNSFAGQFPSTPGRLPTPLTSPRSPFPQWAANIFRSSTGGLMDTEAYGEQRDVKDKAGSPRADGANGANGRWGDGGVSGPPPGTSFASSGGRQPYRRTSANSSSSWW